MNDWKLVFFELLEDWNVELVNLRRVRDSLIVSCRRLASVGCVVDVLVHC